MHVRFAFILLLVQIATPIDAQHYGIGEWQGHLSHLNGRLVEETPGKIYCGTENGIFYFNKADNSINTLSTVDGLSSIDPSALKYHESKGKLVIGYTDGNIDILQKDEITNQPAIANNATILGGKRINDIHFFKDEAFLATQFGIVVYDLEKGDFTKSYRSIGPGGSKVEVFDVAMLDSEIFASTTAGMLKADLGPSANLSDFNNWDLVRSKNTGQMTSFNDQVYAVIGSEIEVYNGKDWMEYGDSLARNVKNMDVNNSRLFISMEKAIYTINKEGEVTVYEKTFPYDALIDKEGQLWYAINQFVLLRREDLNGEPDFIMPNSPNSSSLWKMDFYGNELWVSGGAITDVEAPSFKTNGFYVLNENRDWKSFGHLVNDSLSFYNIRDIVDVAVNPNNDQAFMASYLNGLVEFKDKEFYELYDANNSPISPVTALGDSSQQRVPSVEFDKKGHLWVANNSVDKPLLVKQKNGDWNAYSMGGNTSVEDMEIDDRGQIWLTLQSGGIVIYNHNNTLNDPRDDQYLKLTQGEGNGGLPVDRILSITKDKKGDMWVGTTDGVVVFYSPPSIKSGRFPDGQQIYVEVGQQPGFLLESFNVNNIEVDGSNKKWIATNNGAWYTNEEGTEVINHFTKENSPIVSDNVRDIAVHPETGEVFIGAQGGILSYRGKATKGRKQHGNVYAYPNPVEPDYKGPIAIKGLVTDANVKITDVNGNLVNEFTAEGGQAVWNGENQDGQRVTSGVYLIYSSNESGTEVFMTKLLVIR